MRVDFSNGVISDRLQALTRALDADPVLPGRLLVCSGTWPGRGAALGVANQVLASFAFARPSLVGVTGTTLTLSALGTILVTVSGDAEWARLVDGAGVFVCDLDVSLPSGNGAVKLTTASGTLTLYAGGELSATVAQFAEA